MAISNLAKQIEKHGLTGALSKNNIAMLEVIQGRYRTFLPYFRSMLVRYRGNDKMQAKIKVSISEILIVIKGLQSILTGSIVDYKTVDNIFNKIDEIDSSIKEYSDFAKTDEEFGILSNKALESTGISIDEIKRASEQLSKGKSKINANSGIFKKAISAARESSVAGLGKEALSGLFDVTFGPFAGLFRTVGGAATGAGKFLLNARREKQKKRFASAVLPTKGNVPKDFIESVRASMETGPKISDVFSGVGKSSMPANVMTSYTQPTIEKDKKQKVSYVSTKPEKMTLESKAMPIFYFFDKMAYKAKYTRELLEAITKSKSDKDSGILTDFMSKFKSILSVLGKISAVGIAGAGGFMLGKMIDNKLIKPITDKIDNFISGSVKKLSRTEQADISARINEGKEAKRIRMQTEKFGKSSEKRALDISGITKTDLSQFSPVEKRIIKKQILQHGYSAYAGQSEQDIKPAYKNIIDNREKFITNAKNVSNNKVNSASMARIIRKQRDKFGFSAMAGENAKITEIPNINGTVNKVKNELYSLGDEYTKQAKNIIGVIKDKIEAIPVEQSGNINEVVNMLDRVIKSSENGFNKLVEEFRKTQTTGVVGTGKMDSSRHDSELDALNRGLLDSED